MAAAAALGACGASIGISIGDFDDEGIPVASAPLVAASSLDTVVTLAGPGLGIADDPARLPAGERPRRSLAPGTLDWIERAAGQRGRALSSGGGRFVSDESMGCDSGTMRVRSGFANAIAFAAGDTLELDSLDCRIGGLRFGGGISLRVLDAVGFPGVGSGWTARLSLDYRSWSVATEAVPRQSRTFAGSASLEVGRSIGVDPDLRLDSASLAIVPVIDGAARPARIVQGLALRLLDTAVAGSLQIDLRLLDDRLLGEGLPALTVASVGSIDLPGPTPGFPVGSLRIATGIGSVVLVETIDALQVRLEIDRFADGRIEASQLASRASLATRL